MDVKSLLLFLISTISFIFSFIFIRGERNRANISYALFVLSAAIWSLGLGFFRVVSNLETALIFAKIYYISAAAIPAFFLLFSSSFPKEKEISKTNKLLIFAPLILISLFLILKSDFLIGSIELRDWGKSVSLRKLDYLLYNIYFLAYVIIAYYNLFRSYLASDGMVKRQLNFIFIGTIVPYIIAMYTNLFLPWTNYRYIWIGPLVILPMIVSISYAITRHHLLNIKVIAADLFSALLFIIFIIRFLASESINDFITNIGILIGFTIFSILLIRSVWKEVEAREEIQRLAGRLSDFVSFITHELRTPVTKFSGALSNIVGNYENIPKGELKNLLLKLQIIAYEMGQNIETFLAMNKIEIKKFEVSLKPLDLNKIFEFEVKELQPSARQKKIRLEFRPRRNLPLVEADELQIKRVLDNLVNNAIKYTHEGGKVSVYFEAPRDGEVITVVEGNGIGIEKEVLPTLFTKYERGAKEAKRFAEGSGLGLFIAKTIIEMHGGKIWAESGGKDKGSRFKFSIPVFQKTILEYKNPLAK